MVTTIVIPQDGRGDPRIRELASVGDFQEVVGGWLEPEDIEALGITIWANEAARREGAVMNSRATALHWHYTFGGRSPKLILGDVVVSGLIGHEYGDAPESLQYALFAEQKYLIQAKAADDPEWRDSVAIFDDFFAAIMWCMLLTRSFAPGTAAFRVRTYDPVGEHDLTKATKQW